MKLPRTLGEKVFASILLVIIGSVASMFTFMRPPPYQYHAMLSSNIKQCNLACLMYATDFEDRLPPARYWMGSARPYIPNVHIFKTDEIEGEPAIPRELLDRLNRDPKTWIPGRFGVVFNIHVSGFDVAKGPHAEAPAAGIPLTFESHDRAWNAAGDPREQPLPPRVSKERFGKIVGFMDGHAKWHGNKGVLELPVDPEFPPPIPTIP